MATSQRPAPFDADPHRDEVAQKAPVHDLIREHVPAHRKVLPIFEHLLRPDDQLLGSGAFNLERY